MAIDPNKTSISPEPEKSAPSERPLADFQATILRQITAGRGGTFTGAEIRALKAGAEALLQIARVQREKENMNEDEKTTTEVETPGGTTVTEDTPADTPAAEPAEDTAPGDDESDETAATRG